MAGRTHSLREPLLAAASLAFIIAYALPITFPGVSTEVVAGCEWAQRTVWALFGIDYIIRIREADQKLRFVLHNWFDAIVLLVPVLRPLRLLRAVSLASLAARRFSHGTALRISVAIRTAVTAALVWLLAGLAVTEAEHAHAGSSIRDVGDGLWWAITTMTTVGYGDRYPVSTEGRIIGGGLMVSGIAIFSVVTGTFASWIVERTNEAVALVQVEQQDIHRMGEEIMRLRMAIERLPEPPTDDNSARQP